ncbi:MAG: hypothetical protein JW786_10900, partial [Desulfobacterales bacterium]|nr:hypothetical protein [Desulfobacterales bacterium]
RCISGTVSQRLGAARIFSSNLLSAQFRSYCEDALIKLFNDSDEKVRDEAARCFHVFKGDQLGEYLSLVDAFVQSEAFKTKPHSFLRALRKTTARLPDITCNVCERFVDIMEAEFSGKPLYAGNTDTINQLIFRLYSQSNDESVKTRCLNMIDRMIYLGGYGVDKVLSLYER